MRVRPLPAAPRVVVLSHRVWQERFGSRADVIGRVIRLDDQPATVIGVTRAGWRFPDERAQFWVPYAVPTIEAEPVRTMGFNAIAHLSPGATASQVEAEGTAAARALTRPPSSDVVFRQGRTSRRSRAAVRRGHGGAGAAGSAGSGGDRGARPGSWPAPTLRTSSSRAALPGSASSPSACALGAGRGRLLRQLLVESSLLAIVGGVAGVWLAWALVAVLPAIAPERFPRVNEVTRRSPRAGRRRTGHCCHGADVRPWCPLSVARAPPRLQSAAAVTAVRPRGFARGQPPASAMDCWRSKRRSPLSCSWARCCLATASLG